MEELLVFFQQYGLWITIIAVVGIVLLGVLKYCKVFDKLDEKIRHICYIGVSVAVSIIGAVIYLACVKQLEIVYVSAVAAAILALNQTFYALYDTLTLKELFSKLVVWIVALFSKKKDVDAKEENSEETKTIDESSDKRQ